MEGGVVSASFVHAFIHHIDSILATENAGERAPELLPSPPRCIEDMSEGEGMPKQHGRRRRRRQTMPRAPPHARTHGSQMGEWESK